jgi:hypothetical protein
MRTSTGIPAVSAIHMPPPRESRAGVSRIPSSRSTFYFHLRGLVLVARSAGVARTMSAIKGLEAFSVILMTPVA